MNEVKRWLSSHRRNATMSAGGAEGAMPANVLKPALARESNARAPDLRRVPQVHRECSERSVPKRYRQSDEHQETVAILRNVNGTKAPPRRRYRRSDRSGGRAFRALYV